MCAGCACEDQKAKPSGALKLEVQVVVSCLLSTGDQTRILCNCQAICSPANEF
ncbi:hypothetical protein I79_009589 [Cricetulus griseus]|uniref:Uncharacterized protein n=1 Tax=Cricetulus griseus TaxID=10029 RepID=G3HG70_CRIGR|nr:hypothetical protein I79_009589 [Cricetulus griseus]